MSKTIRLTPDRLDSTHVIRDPPSEPFSEMKFVLTISPLPFCFSFFTLFTQEKRSTATRDESEYSNSFSHLLSLQRLCRSSSHRLENRFVSRLFTVISARFNSDSCRDRENFLISIFRSLFSLYCLPVCGGNFGIFFMFADVLTQIICMDRFGAYSCTQRNK